MRIKASSPRYLMVLLCVGMLDVLVFHDITEILLKVALNTIALTPGCSSKLMAFLTPEIYS
jgi:hypothetical protein